MQIMKILITGSAGFIGFHLSIFLLKKEFDIIGIDNLNDYYDVNLKMARLDILNSNKKFKFYKEDIKNKENIDKIFKDERPDYVINLAAQAGVRYSITNPYAYVDSNLVGFVNILEACRNFPVKHLIYASSSSVYGGNQTIPFSPEHSVDHPVSLYAATKKSNELMAHTYSHLYNIPTTGLRFFTVYGPWGRPDMAYFSFTENIVNHKEIKIFNNGEMERDFTYIDDIVYGIYKLIDRIPKENKEWNEKKDSNSESFAPYKIFNIGNNNPVKLMKFVNILEQEIGIDANKIFLEMQAGDVVKTYADISDLEKQIKFRPNTSIDLGIKKFVIWYKEFYKVK
ncbi:MAG: NAD-dependent epimerase [Fusobacteriaceae bacterium]|nr:NAD-dependent epimerase [Fusobacteriaceae bacterium]